MNNASAQIAASAVPADALTPQQQLAYALPVIGAAFLIGPIGMVKSIYAIYFGLSLATISLVVLIARLFDAFTDPLIGYFSDRYYALVGNRKAFIVCGGVLMILSSFFLFVPVNPYTVDDSTSVSGMYFLICFLGFYFSYTLFEIPHLAWASELAILPSEKNGLFAWRSAMMFLSVMLFYCVPFLPIFDTREITPETLLWSVIFSAIILPITLYVNYRTVPGARTAKTNSATVKASSKQTPRLYLTLLIKNRPFLLFLLTFLMQGLAVGIQSSLVFIYISSFLGIGEHIAPISIVSLCSSLLSLRLWYVLAARWSKKLTWSLGIGVYCLGLLMIGTLIPNALEFNQLYWGFAILGLGMSAGNIIAPSMLSDIVDYSRWKFQIDCGGSFFAIYTLVNKINIAVGTSLGFLLVNGFGFDLSGTEHSPESIWGLRLVIAGLPIILSLLSILFIALLPIYGRRHAIVFRRLNAEQNSLKNHKIGKSND